VIRLRCVSRIWIKLAEAFMTKKREQDKKVDEGVDQTFPASDPTATGEATSTEAPKSPKDRKAPHISKEDIEQAQRGAGHKQN
jgi:hypothetical protein